MSHLKSGNSSPSKEYSSKFSWRNKIKKSKIVFAWTLLSFVSFSVYGLVVVSTILLRNISFFPKSKNWEKWVRVRYVFFEKNHTSTLSFSPLHFSEYPFEKSTLHFLKKYQKTSIFILEWCVSLKSFIATIFFIIINIFSSVTCCFIKLIAINNESWYLLSSYLIKLFMIELSCIMIFYLVRGIFFTRSSICLRCFNINFW